MPSTLTPEWKNNLGENCQKIYSEYLNNYGNLTITALNSELSNKSFEDKKKIYETSNINLNRQISKYEKWGKEEIEDRAEKLANYAIQIWVKPKIEK